MSDDQQGFLMCMPLSRTPRSVKSIEAKCCICRGKVGINPNNTFEGIPTPNLQPICGFCLIDLADGGEEMTTGAFGVSKHLPPHVREWALKMIEDNKILDMIRANKNYYKADDPGKEN